MRTLRNHVVIDMTHDEAKKLDLAVTHALELLEAHLADLDLDSDKWTDPETGQLLSRWHDIVDRRNATRNILTQLQGELQRS